MFDFIRNNRRFLQVVLLVLVLPSFILFGIQGYSNMGDANNLVSVGQQRISQAELDNAVRNRLEEIKKTLGDKYDSKLYDTPEMHQKVLDGIVNQKVLLAESVRNNVLGSDQKITDFVKAIPGVYENNKYDEEAYKRIVSTRAPNIPAFEAGLKSEMGVQTLYNGVQNTALVSKQLIEQLSIGQERTITAQELLFKAEPLIATLKVDPAALAKFYADNLKRFELPEQAKAEYFVLDATTAAGNIAVAALNDAEIKAAYDAAIKNKRFVTPEERQVAHILIKLDAKASAADIAVAKSKIDALAVQLKQNPAQFAAIAKASSDDTGSAAQNGDLGTFTQEAMSFMGKSFVDTAFATTVNELSAPVKTDYGWHIVQVKAVKAGLVKSYEAVKNELEAELKASRSASKLLDYKKDLLNELGLLQQSASLKSVADKFKLELKTQDTFTPENARQMVQMAQATQQILPSKLFNTKVLDVLFSKDSIDTKNNTGAIEIAKNEWVIARLVDYTAAKAQPLEQVKTKVEALLRQELAVKQAQTDGEAKLKALRTKSDTAVEGLSAAKEFSRQKPNGLSTAAFATVARASAGTLPAWAGVTLPNGDYAVYKVTALGAMPTLDDVKRNAVKQAVNRVYAEQELQSVLTVLKARHNVKLLKKPSAADTVDPLSTADAKKTK
jgi:peptidyl-prolyl cis-trans isomerase D